MKNPFNPTFGDVPRLFIGNGEEEKIIELIRESDFDRYLDEIQNPDSLFYLGY